MTPPKPTELEVTLIGPGVGECVVLHYDGSWFVIDSCIDRETKNPAALRYLASLGVDASQIAIVACSHWHDDHIRGISDVLAAAPNAKFCMSTALAHDEFISLIQVYKDGLSDEAPFTSGVAELTRALKILKDRNTPPKLATQNQRIYMANGGTVELWSLSPSSQNVTETLLGFAKLMPPLWTNRFTLPAKGPNHLAVAMHFRVGEHSVLLGSDLEEHGNSHTGWSAVIGSAERPPQMASLYKIAHHGSVTAEHEGIWDSLLSPNPLAIITPFSRSKLPRTEDVNRIKGRSSRVFITANGTQPAVRRTGALAKMVKANNLSAFESRPGLLQCRIDCSIPGSDWQIVKQGSALQL
jgi:beta-lactamase superfamily II metal-dependent hydrolase